MFCCTCASINCSVLEEVEHKFADSLFGDVDPKNSGRAIILIGKVIRIDRVILNVRWLRERIDSTREIMRLPASAHRDSALARVIMTRYTYKLIANRCE